MSKQLNRIESWLATLILLAGPSAASGRYAS